MLAHPIAQQIEYWLLSRFIPYARNPRKNDHAVDRMAGSISEFGFKVPVLARSSGDVIDGHLRLKAAQKLGLIEIPVIICDDWTEAQVKAFRLLVNRSVTWADWDPELLSLKMLNLRNLDYDIDLSGFDTHEIDELLLAQSEDPHEDDAPAPPENPVSRAGDLWLCGKHRILCADATSPEAVSRLLGERKPRIMITDPPYYWFQHEPCWYVRKKNAPWFGKAGENSTVWDSPSPKFIMGGSKEDKIIQPKSRSN
jgi:hypothetical protein